MRLEGPVIDREASLDDLYGAPVDQFTAARNDLADRLKEAGDIEGAAMVKALKKPSVSAAVINQLVRQRPLDVARLLKSGEALETAQRSLMAGKPADLATAKKDEAAAVKAMIAAAKEIQPGISAAVLDRVTQTLRTASTPGARELLRQGRLTDDLDPTGFEAYVGVETGAKPKSTEKLPNRRKVLLTEKRTAAEERVKASKVEAKEMEKAARATEAAAKKAALELQAATKRLELAEAELARIEADLARPRLDEGEHSAPAGRVVESRR